MYKFPFVTTSAFSNRGDGKLCPPHLKRNMDSPINFINCICIVTRDRSWEVKLFICFLKKTLLKVLKPSVTLFAFFWLQLSSAFAIIFAECRGLYVHLRASWYTALFRVSLLGVGLRCVGLAQKISARCKRVFKYNQTATIRQSQFANRSTGSWLVVNRKSDKPSLIRWKRVPEVNLQDTWKIFCK